MNTQTVRLTTLVSKMQASSIVKLQTGVISQLARMVVEAGAGAMIDELLDYVAIEVDTQELQVSPGWYESLCTCINKKAPLLRKNLAELQHTSEGALSNVRPQPDTCRFFAASELASLNKAEGRVTLVEGAMSNNRKELENSFIQATNKAIAMNYIRMYEHAVTLLAAGKKMKGTFDCNVTGVVDADKLKTVRFAWLMHAKTSCADLQPIVETVQGFKQFEEANADKDESDDEEVHRS